MTEVKTEGGVIIPTTAVVESVSKGGDGMRKGSVAWKLYFTVDPAYKDDGRMVRVLSDRRE